MSLDHATVLVVDECTVVRDALCRLINDQVNVTCCGTAADPVSGFEIAQISLPDIILIDIAYQNAPGFDFIKNLKAALPKASLIVYSLIDGPAYIENALRLGVRGYISKTESQADVLRAIECVRSGQVYLHERRSAQFLSRLAQGPGANSKASIEKLSRAEFEVFHLIGRAMSNQQIATMLHRSTKTIETYRARIKEKLGLKTSTELAHFAFSCQSRSSEKTVPPSSEGNEMKNKASILVVDDHAICRDPLVQILALSGFTALGAENGEQALTALAERDFDLIITDLMMPRMNGIAFIQAVQASPRWHGTPMIAMTATSDGAAIEQARNLVGKIMLKSKFSVQELLGAIETLLAAKQQLIVAA